jgi:hypothetical protein
MICMKCGRFGMKRIGMKRIGMKRIGMERIGMKCGGFRTESACNRTVSYLKSK